MILFLHVNNNIKIAINIILLMKVINFVLTGNLLPFTENLFLQFSYQILRINYIICLIHIDYELYCILNTIIMARMYQ